MGVLAYPSKPHKTGKQGREEKEEGWEKKKGERKEKTKEGKKTGKTQLTSWKRSKGAATAFCSSRYDAQDQPSFFSSLAPERSTNAHTRGAAEGPLQPQSLPASGQVSAWVLLRPHPALTHSPASLQSRALSYQSPFSNKPSQLSKNGQRQQFSLSHRSL